MAKANPIPSLVINALTAGIPAIVEAAKARKENRARKVAEAVAKVGNSQLTGGLIAGAAINSPEVIFGEIPEEILNAPEWLQYSWVGLTALGLITRIAAQFMKAKAAKLPKSEQ